VVWGLRRQELGQLITEAHADAHAKSTGVRPFSGGGVVGVEAPGGWLRWGGWREQPRLQRLRWAGWVELPLAKKEGALRLTARIWGGAGDEGSHEGAGAEDGRAAVHESLDAGWERRERLCIHHKRLSVHGSCEGVAASTHTTHTPPGRLFVAAGGNHAVLQGDSLRWSGESGGGCMRIEPRPNATMPMVSAFARARAVVRSGATTPLAAIAAIALHSRGSVGDVTCTASQHPVQDAAPGGAGRGRDAARSGSPWPRVREDAAAAERGHRGARVHVHRTPEGGAPWKEKEKEKIEAAA